MTSSMEKDFKALKDLTTIRAIIKKSKKKSKSTKKKPPKV